MARNTQRSSYQRRYNAQSEYETYIEGNVVRKQEKIVQPQKRQSADRAGESRKEQKEKTFYMNLGYVAFLTVALICAAVILMSHIRIQSEIAVRLKSIAELEKELNDLRISNDEEYSRAESSVDLEEVRRVAIGELGMRYAKEGQIINVTGEGSDYVRQLAQIEE